MSVVKRDFDKEAAAWDIPVRVKLSEDVAGVLARHIPLDFGMNVLDFGCGTGLLSLSLLPKVRTITGMDTSRGMLDVFNDKLARRGIASVRTVHLEADQDVPLAGAYHLIVSNMTLHHIEDTRSVVKKFSAAMLPGGYLAVTDLDLENGLFHDSHEGVFHHGFDRGVLRRLFVEAGLEDIQDHPAVEMTKPGADGITRTFSIFLMIGRKRGV